MRLIKKALKNPKAALLVVISKFHFLSDKAYIKLKYFISFGKRINLKNPKTYNEKLNWLKLYDRNPKYPKMVDKFGVREYIKEKIGEEYLIPLLGVWDSFEEIDFDSLPNQFVLKCTHDSGSVVICKDKTTFDIEKAKEKLNRKFKKNLYWWSREWVYKDLKPKIIAEKYMEDSEYKELRDYKFFCFSGEPKCLFVATERPHNTKFDFFDLEFNHLPILNGHPNSEKQIEKPKCFDKMIELSKILSQGMKHVRVDFYEIDGRIYFGELTFFHYSGFIDFEPDEWNYKFGEWIDLSK
ncbi:MAG: glycosyl transferase [Ruminococcaceae bacterium]|nr:glycosyl transferase [Oscillospiraceae bacterium]